MKINKIIPVNRPVIGLYEKKFLLDAFNKNQLTSGSYLSKFEKKICIYT